MSQVFKVGDKVLAWDNNMKRSQARKTRFIAKIHNSKYLVLYEDEWEWMMSNESSDAVIDWYENIDAREDD